MPLPFYSDFNKEAGAQSREKAKAERRVQQFQSSEKKDWDSFTANTARKSFVQQLGKDPMTDPKLLQYADNMNRLKTGSKITSLPGDAGKSYQITKLRGSERLGCTCNDWRYKKSVAQPGEEQDCKHIKQYRQMSKTATATREGAVKIATELKDVPWSKRRELFEKTLSDNLKDTPVDEISVKAQRGLGFLAPNAEIYAKKHGKNVFDEENIFSLGSGSVSLRKDIFKPRWELEADALYLTPEFKGKGIGGSLFKGVLRAAKDLGVDKVTLQADEDGKAVWAKMPGVQFQAADRKAVGPAYARWRLHNKGPDVPVGSSPKEYPEQFLRSWEGGSGRFIGYEIPISKTAADEAGKSVVVTGHSGSGKSTYANELSRRTGLPVVSLDKEPEIRDLLENQKILFRETGSLGLSQTKDAERRALQAALSRHVDSPKILEGSYFLGHTDLIPDGAETVLVNRPLDVILDQRIKRDVARAKEKGKAPDPARIEKVTRELHRYYEPGVAELLRRGVKTAAASFKDTLPNPVIDGKPHSGTWTIVGSGRLSIPKKTSDIDYMVPLEEVKDLSSFQEYSDVPGVYWRDSETIDGRPSTIVALPRYAYDKIDASYQQATDRFGRRKLRQLKKTLPKDSFYKDIGVVYTSDAMKKEGEQQGLASFLRDADFSKTASIALNRTMMGAAIGGISGGVGGWASGDGQEQSIRNAAVGGAVGAGLGSGAGYAYHKLRPAIGRMRGLSQALDNESPMLWTADGLRVDTGKKSPPKSHDKFVYETPSVRVFRDGDRLGAYVVPITKDVAGRDAPVLVWRTDTKSSPEEFAALALEYAKKHSSVDPAHVRDFEKKGGHVEDRIAERAPGAEAEVNTLRAKLRQMQLRKGQTYHVPLSRGKGYAVIGDVGDKHAVKTVLGPNMRPPGERLKLAEDAAVLTSELKPHQERVLRKLETSDGVIVAHRVGAGKTLTAIAAAVKSGKPVEVITPASLTPNFEKEMKKHVRGEIDARIRSYEKATKDAKEGKGIDTSRFLIIDEAHRLRNSGTQAAALLRSEAGKAPKRVLLTGTALYNQPSDIAPLANIAAGQTVLPVDQASFDKKFIREVPVDPGFFLGLMGVAPGVKKNLKNSLELERALAGRIDLHDEAPTADFPEQIEERIKVPMTRDQHAVYETVMGKAPLHVRMKIKAGLPPSKQEAKDLNAFVSGGRQASLSPRPYVRSMTDGQESLNTPKIQEASRRLRASLKADPNFRGVVYSNYIDAGIVPYEKALRKHNVPFETLTGSLSAAQKAKLVENYNSGKTKVLLVSSSGTEGLDLKGTKMVQVLEPHWNNSKIDQVIGRGVRFQSHAHLPPEERKVVVQRYYSTLPQSPLAAAIGLNPGKSTEEWIQDRADEKTQLAAQMRAVLLRASNSQVSQ